MFIILLAIAINILLSSGSSSSCSSRVLRCSLAARKGRWGGGGKLHKELLCWNGMRVVICGCNNHDGDEKRDKDGAEHQPQPCSLGVCIILAAKAQVGGQHGWSVVWIGNHAWGQATHNFFFPLTSPCCSTSAPERISLSNRSLGGPYRSLPPMHIWKHAPPSSSDGDCTCG